MQALFKFELPALVKKKRGYYLSSCPILDIHSQGDTEKQSLEHLTEALSLFLVSCFERGKLDEVLKKSGFQPIMNREIKKTAFPKKYKTIGVPLPFTIPNRVHSPVWHA